MRIALFSDIHGNAVALDAVLADIQRNGGVDEYWILGDLVAVGAQPVQVLEKLAELPNLRFTRGNTDEYITTGSRPAPSADEVEADLSKLSTFEEVALTMAWTQGCVSTAGWMPFLDSLPLEQRLTLPSGECLLGVHASPGENNSRGIRPDYEADEVNARFGSCEANIICVGHTHWPMNAKVGGKHVINLGSVGNARVPTIDAWYAIIEADQNGYQVTHHAVAYDLEKCARLVNEVRHPAGGFIRKFLRGERVYPFDEKHLPTVLRR